MPSHLSNANNNLFANFDWTKKINLKFPKFKMTQSINPKDLLEELGKLQNLFLYLTQ